MYPSTQPLLSQPPTRYISSMKAETNTSMNSPGPSHPLALSGIPSILFLQSAGTMVILKSFRKNHNMELRNKSTQRRRKTSLRSNHDDTFQSFRKQNGDQWPNWNYRSMERHQFACSLSKIMGYYSLRLLWFEHRRSQS